MKTIIAIAIGIIMLSLVGAVELYSGDSYNFTLTEDFEYYSVVGNLSPVNVTFSGLDVLITPNKYSPSDSFEVIFFNAEDKIIYYAVESSSSGGGGGGSRTIYKNNTIYVNQTDSPDELLIPEEDEVKDNSWIWWVFIIGVIIVIIIIIIVVIKMRESVQ